MDLFNDKRLVMTLDAGGTNFCFSAMQAGKALGEGVALPSNGDDLERCLQNIVTGFTDVQKQCPAAPAAISFAFPGPSDFPNGIIGDLWNLTGFRGGVALGPMLADRFDIPVFINNDGDLFVYGEAIAGFLPKINGLLEAQGSPKRYHNLCGVTLGTGFGGGIVCKGELFIGDNSMAAEVWLLRNKLAPQMNAEEGASIRAVRRVYADRAGIALDEAPEPKDIYAIGTGAMAGDRSAALEAFRQLGEVVGDGLGSMLTLVDGLAVVGGGLSGAASLFLPALVDELNSEYRDPEGKPRRRLATQAFNLEEARQREVFLKGDARRIKVPGSTREVEYDPMQRVGVGLSVLGTSEAVAIGAYAFALNALG